MKKIIAIFIILSGSSAHSLSPNEMFIIIGAVKYYNENCGGLSYQGIKQMNKGLKRFDMDEIPVPILEQNPMALSGFKTAENFGCQGTRNEAFKAGYGAYIN
ncbi:hypothetical protein CRYPA_1646 [uncultured Candidatus Thioglobus sp.]|uniref:hypothetical protein n=1 Tax=Bathymodiolus heckerae thiotrophic gill symbiont TaxID=1052212 RepID=UPI0010B15BA1|nr:hypothetical protein [Bathymodiolus heckerae thiotrophic gill symbiont]CAC9542444.1 hypothetical protein [uncultured Gammaproteobacteria bacterium]SMN15615.1 hypothetical protein CRYPA_1646 [uncultured Candidatus Thioglobus sp.]CAC9603212.1 hypothetical protein [uncultured Gammaproteobacteria bacterium]CAC9957503.1 hypothetical protein [uncultured Gammaproteobacteria bacterium]SHN90034.1 hypothetical protein BHECKSOX_182 [Bathymodiolus heckerae thiotrophic gill symbiont]